MSSVDAYKKLRERMKEYGLTPEEEAAIEKAARKVKTHSTIGTIAGASICFMIARRRGFTPPSTLLFTAGGFFVGSQLGILTGAISSFRVIRKLPDPGHLVGILRDLQNEMMENRSKRIISPVHRSQSKQVDGFIPDTPPGEETDRNFERDQMKNTDRMLNDQEIERERSRDPALRRQQESQKSSVSMEPYAYPDNTSGSSASLPPPDDNRQQSGDTWAQIRSKKLPDERPTWAKIREREMHTDSRGDQTQQEINDEARNLGREENRRGEENRREVKKRLNQYGDPIE